VRILALCCLLLPACFGPKLPRHQVALADMEEPLALHGAPDDEEAREELALGGFTGAYVADSRQSLEEMDREPEGVLVTRVVENGPADVAGLRDGDLILEADGKELAWASEWRKLELAAQPGQEIEVVYDRAGAEREARIVAAARLHPAGREDPDRFREEDRVGIVVRTATEVEARGAGLGPGGGAVLVGMSRTSPWRGAGLKFGDVIIEADSKPVSHPHVLLRAIRDAPKDGIVKLVYVRGGKRSPVDVPVSRRAQETLKTSIPLLYYY